MLSTLHQSMIERNITSCHVFDGHTYRMKSKTHEERDDTREKAKEKPHSFYELGEDASAELVVNDCAMPMKHTKTMVTTGNETISLVLSWLKVNHVNCMCAPFEAECQCMLLQKK